MKGFKLFLLATYSHGLSENANSDNYWWFLTITGIEEMVDSMNLEENLAVVQIGKGRAWVRQHLTNDYSRVRETIGEQRYQES